MGTEQTFGETSLFIESIGNENFRLTSNNRNNFNPHNINVSKQLRKDDSIVITKPDKGRGVFLLNKQDYLKKREHSGRQN